MSTTAKLTIDVPARDLAELQDWARNSGQSVEALIGEALERYMRDVRADHADLDRRLAGPSHEHEEAMRILAERRRDWRPEAAE